MTFIAVRCPHCQSDQSVKRSKTARSTQRSLCQPPRWVRGSCLLDSGNRGGLPAVKPTISAMRLKARGGRDTARSLPLCPNTVRRALTKKAAAREAVHPARLRTRPPAEVTGDLERAGAAEVAERGAFVGDKGPPRWLWQASDPHPGQGWASVVGRRPEEGFVQRKALRKPGGLPRDSPDSWGASTRQLAPAGHWPGTRHPQKSARQPLIVRTRITRLVRKTLCCSKTPQMQDSVIGLVVNRSACGRTV